MADHLRSQFASQVEVKLVSSGGGKFEVSADGKLIFSRLQTHRFPKNEEITGEIQKSLS